MPQQSEMQFTLVTEGGPAWEVVKFTLTEALSQPFRLEVDLASLSASVDFDALLDTPVTFTIHRDGVRIPIVPIRYAVVPKAADAKALAYDASPYDLERGFDRIKGSAYTLRALRPGYVYVYMKGNDGDKFVIHEHEGEGTYRELRYGGLQNYGRRDKYQEGPKRICVWADTCADEAWICYSQHLWTNAITRKVQTDSKYRDLLMHKLDMKELTAGIKSPSKQKHVLPLEAMSEWVEDYKDNARRIPLGWSCHYAPQARTAPLASLAADYPHTQPRVPAVVALYDAEGITLDLGLIAAAFQHQAVDLKNPGLKGKSGENNSVQGLPSCMDLDVERMDLASAEFHRKNLMATLLEQALESMYLQADSRRRLPANGQIPMRTLIDEDISPDGARLGERIDWAMYNVFLVQRRQAEAQLKAIYAQVERACGDHDVWLASAEQKNAGNPTGLAAALYSYDRDYLVSARALEQSLALLMHGMGMPLPGRHAHDPRFKRLGRWIDDPKSPLYVALAAYNPFKEKADDVGEVLGGAGALIELLGDTFPDVNGATDLIAQNVTTVVLSRMQGATRWSSSPRLLLQVQRAAREANAGRVLGLLRARYRITDTLVAADDLSEDIRAALDNGMAELERTGSRVEVVGTRTVNVIETQQLTVRPTFKALVNAAVGAGINHGVLYFNVINLMSAYNDISKRQSLYNVTNFAEAIFGTVGALGAAAVSIRSTYVTVIARTTTSMPGVAYGAGVTKLLESKLFGRITGWGGIGFCLATDWQKAYQLNKAGNKSAARATFYGGAAVAIGSVAILEASLAAAAGTATVPVAGWIIAAGILLIAGGLWLFSRAAAAKNRPLELWATRSVFGNRMGDGEERNDVPLDQDGRPLAYPNLLEEIQGWYFSRYAPVLLDDDAAEELGWEGADSSWHDNYGYPDTAEFTVLLPGFLIGQSTWDGNTSSSVEKPAPNGSIILFGNLPEARISQHGLLLRFHHQAYTNEHGDLERMNLRINYKPNQGIDENAKVFMFFQLED